MLTHLGEELLKRLDALAEYSESGPGLTRMPFTPEHRGANALIQEWMDQAGLETHLDAAGTLIGRREGPVGAPTLLLGSHQDSIRRGGKYDGMLGIALPILVLEQLKCEELPYSIEVLAFADEEGVRFPTALMGPRTLAGTFNSEDLNLTDKSGVKLSDALKDFGGQPDKLASLKRKPKDVLGFIETHIEQGPVLEQMNRGLGVVTAICGIERWTVTLTGKTRHAGTSPMSLRYDAFAGAAEIALEIEKQCSAKEQMVGVVGQINVFPNVVNAIPGRVEFSVELRAASDETRSSVSKCLTDAVEAIAKKRKLELEVVKSYSQKAVPCDPALSDVLANAIEAVDAPAPRIMSGATHDASAMADLCPVAMLFVRCKDGISHHPDEAISAEDAYLAMAALDQALRSISI